MTIEVIITIPPYAAYLDEAARHPLVSGLRLNTVMPVKDGPEEALQRLSGTGKPLWVDLKSRQLRVVGAAIPPFTQIRVSHPVRVDTPADIYFSDGREHGRVVAVDGDKLILEDGPRRLIGPGESINIPHASLEIDGLLTPNDIAYLEGMSSLGLRNVMLSYVESPDDIDAVRAIIPESKILPKIETQRGLAFARAHGGRFGNLIAARGDLYVEVRRPHLMPGVMREIIEADPQSIAASRIFDSMAAHPIPSNADVHDMAFLLSLGYRRFMLGDYVCLQRETLLETLNLMEAMAAQYS